MASKPTGEIGVATYTRDEVIYDIVEFPAEKPDIEESILSFALHSGNNPTFSLIDHYGLAGNPVQLPQDDIDFLLPLAGGHKTRLELMEIAPLTGPYKDAPSSYKVGDRAEWIWSKISEKSEEYGSGYRVHLLTYTTEYRFELDGSVRDLLIHLAHSRAHNFISVVHCSLNDGVRLIFPVAANVLSGLEPVSELIRITSLVFPPYAIEWRNTPYRRLVRRSTPLAK